LAGCNRFFALDEEPGALDNRHVDHLAVHSHRADTLGGRFVIGGDDTPGVVGVLGAGAKLLVEDRNLARMDDRGADEAEPARAPDRLPETIEVVKLGDCADEAQRHDAGGAGGKHCHLLRHEQPLGLGQDPGRQCEVLGAEVEGAEPWVGAGDIGNAEEGGRGLDHRNEAGRPRRHAALGLDLVDDFSKQPHMLGVVRLGEEQTQYSWADHRLNVAHREAQWPVDADHDVGAAARDDLGGLRYQGAGPLLFGGRDAVFEVEDDRIGAAPGRPVDKTPGGHRHEQQ
jgi:hypothetical protein